jgi:hypothetical protein
MIQPVHSDVSFCLLLFYPEPLSLVSAVGVARLEERNNHRRKVWYVPVHLDDCFGKSRWLLAPGCRSQSLIGETHAPTCCKWFPSGRTAAFIQSREGLASPLVVPISTCVNSPDKTKGRIHPAIPEFVESSNSIVTRCSLMNCFKVRLTLRRYERRRTLDPKTTQQVADNADTARNRATQIGMSVPN